MSKVLVRRFEVYSKDKFLFVFDSLPESVDSNIKFLFDNVMLCIVRISTVQLDSVFDVKIIGKDEDK